MYYYEIHCHTQETSRCGASPAREMMAAYHQKGFTGVVVTDHFVNGYSYANTTGSWKEKIDAFVKGYQAAKTAGDEWGLKVYFGFEYTAAGGNGEDYLTLGLQPEQVYQDLVDCDQWPLEAFIHRVHALGGIVVRAHPYREAGYIRQSGIERPGMAIDAVEVFNGGNTQEIFNIRAMHMALKEGKPFVAGSDTHQVKTTATDYIGFAEDPADYPALCAAIREGKAFLVHKPKG